MEVNNNISKSCSRKGLRTFTVEEKYLVLTISTIVAFFSYLNSISGDFVHDDVFAIKENPDVSGQREVFLLFSNDFWGKPMTDEGSHKSFRPFTTLTFRWNYWLSSGEPFSFHVVNVILHSVMTLLVTLTCLALTLPSASSLMAGILFAVHPVHSEAVAGIVGRAELLAGIFFLLSFLSYLRGLHRPHCQKFDIEVKVIPWSLRWVFVSVLLAGAAMLCKENGVTVLGICLVYDIFLFNKNITKKLFSHGILEKPNSNPLMIRTVVVVFSICTLLGFRLWMNNGQQANFQYQDNPASFTDDRITRVLTYVHLWTLNIWKLLTPAVLCYDWQIGSIPLVESVWDLRNIASFVFVCTFIFIGWRWVYQYFQENNDSDPHQPCAVDVMFISVVIMVVSFLPASNLFMRVGFVLAERVLYIPSIGYCMLVGYGCHHLMLIYQSRKTHILCSYLFLVLLFLTKTYQQNQTWLTRESLFKSGVKVLPHNAKAHYNFANYLKDAGHHEQAIHHYTISVELFPANPSAHNNLGVLYSNRSKAAFHFQQALNYNKDHVSANVNLAQIIFNNGNRSQGVDMIASALSKEPGHKEGIVTLANMMVEMKEYQEAKLLYQRAFKLFKGDNPDWLHNYGVVLQYTGDIDEALQYYHMAFSLSKKHTASLLAAAKLLSSMKKWSEAEELYNRALMAKREVQTLDSLAMLYHRTGRHHSAIKLYQTVVEEFPNNTDVMFHYAQVLMLNKEVEKAVKVLLQVLAQQPNNVDYLSYMANALGQSSKHSEAMKYIDQAIQMARKEQRSSLSELLFQRGNHYRDLNKYKEALMDYLETVNLDPNHTKGHLNVGGIYHLQGDLKKAREHYHTVLKLDPVHNIAKSNLEKLNRIEAAASKKGG